MQNIPRNIRARALPLPYLGLLLLFTCAICFCAGRAHSQGHALFNTHPSSLNKTPSAEEAFKLTLSHTPNTLNLAWTIAPECYLYAKSLQAELTLPDGEKVELLKAVPFPKAEILSDPAFDNAAIYRDSLVVSLPFESILQTIEEAQATLRLTLHYQGCATSGFCYPPMKQDYKLSIHDQQIKEISSQSPTITAQLSPEENASSVKNKTKSPKSAFHTILTFFGFGILLTFTPCVLPMIPILFGVIVGQKHLNTRKAFYLSLTYVICMALTYAIAGMIVASLGKNLQAYLQQPAVLIPFAALFAYLGFTQIGLFKLSLPGQFYLKNLLHALHAKQESGSYLGAGIMGILATLISSPCVTPPLIAALGYISQNGNVILGGSALLALGLGMGCMLLVMGTIGGKYVPRSGPWVQAVNQTVAIILFSLSVYLLDRLYHGSALLVLWGIICLYAAWCLKTFQRSNHNCSGRFGVFIFMYGLVLFWGALRGESDPLQPLRADLWGKSAPHLIAPSLTTTTIRTLPEFIALQSPLQNQTHSHPLMLIFYADWCQSCQYFEGQVLAKPTVRSQLSPWSIVRVDLTHYNESSQQLLKHFDLIGPPAVLFFNEQGSEIRTCRLTGEISPPVFLKTLAECQILTHQ